MFNYKRFIVLFFLPTVLVWVGLAGYYIFLSFGNKLIEAEQLSLFVDIQSILFSYYVVMFIVFLIRIIFKTKDKKIKNLFILLGATAMLYIFMVKTFNYTAIIFYKYFLAH